MKVALGILTRKLNETIKLYNLKYYIYTTLLTIELNIIFLVNVCDKCRLYTIFSLILFRKLKFLAIFSHANQC